MSDETELNIELTEDLSAIESTLLGLQAGVSSIDQDTLMYQAGWAAAMAECDRDALQRSATVTNAQSRFWPAMTMTFAMTTAACLMVILMPPLQTGVEVATNAVDQTETIPEPANNAVAVVDVQNPEIESPIQKTVPPKSVQSLRFGLAQWLGVPVEKMLAKRKEQFEKHLAEAMSPSGSVLPESDDDWDFEPTVPLTPRSHISFSL